jgi:signal transduction histidine kinase
MRSSRGRRPRRDVSGRRIYDFRTRRRDPEVPNNVVGHLTGDGGNVDQHQSAVTARGSWPYQPGVVEESTVVAELKARLEEEISARRRAECLGKIQSDAVQLSFDLLVREPDIEGFMGMLSKTLTEEAESHTCAIWLQNDDEQRAEPWMAYVQDRLIAQGTAEWDAMASPRESMGQHLFSHKPGWTEIVEYGGNDPRLPETVRAFNARVNIHSFAVAPLRLGTRTLGWVALSTAESASFCESQWRMALLDAIAKQATLALHHHQFAERRRHEERKKATLEERNRLARDIHDTLAQGFAAILMQLQAAQRESDCLPRAVASSLDTAVELARTHMTDARRSVGALRPNVGDVEDLGRSLSRIAELARRTSEVPIELVVDDLPRYGEVVEREIAGVAQEALTNAVRHSRARRIVLRASAVRSIGFRLSVADDGRGIGESRSNGFGMTSMQERAERIGASLTIVTAPRSGTEVVLAWQPAVTGHADYFN